MTAAQLTRQQITAALVKALEPQPFIYAMWEGGSAAFDRLDEWSDLDIQVDVEDEHVLRVFELVEAALLTFSPIQQKYEMPQPTWHGHHQTFYRLANASPFLIVDLAVMKHSSTQKFLEAERHGRAIVLFDKAGVVNPPPLDQVTHQQHLSASFDQLVQRFEMFHNFTEKEIYRNHPIEAIAFYHGFVLRPLVEVLRMKYQPDRYDFGTRYLAYDLPVDVVQQLERLYLTTALDELLPAYIFARAWFRQTAAELRR